MRAALRVGWLASAPWLSACSGEEPRRPPAGAPVELDAATPTACADLVAGAELAEDGTVTQDGRTTHCAAAGLECVLPARADCDGGRARATCVGGRWVGGCEP